MSELWLSKIKPNDMVIVQHRSRETIGTVAKITPTGIIKLTDGSQFTSGGRERGVDVWGVRWLHELTDGKRAEFEHRDLANWVSKIDWSKCSTDQLRRIKAITEEGRGDG